MTTTGLWADRGRRRLALAGAGGCLLAGLGYLAGTDPHDPSSLLPRCPVRAVTGLDCPACGGLRLTYDLLHGMPAAAVRDNLFLLVCSPLLVILVLRQARAFDRGRPAPLPRAVGYGLAGAALAWMAVRNLPGWPLTPTSG
ncbi:DUF2752 domain-containing protein [Parafrankia discariae]|uniref:DUF2752 domain-containing protein n=1 Tax=Parafrankia discariae TaxID=365528 RepID=UPI000367E65E|nr:DUF2752 domain-containing protein [Parafrankia discariae]